MTSTLGLFLVLASLASAGAPKEVTEHGQPVPEPSCGTDEWADRLEYYEINDPAIRALADSSVALVKESMLQPTESGYRLKSNKLFAGKKFKGQPQSAFCSGSLVGDDIVLTAAHCIPDGDCGGIKFVFGFAYLKEGHDPTLVGTTDVYGCAGVISRELDDKVDHMVRKLRFYDKGGGDWALLRLDAPTTGRKPLAINDAGELNADSEVFVIGYPKGLPLKLMGNAYTGHAKINCTYRDFFLSDLDIWKGNSGSPVFNAQTRLIEGVAFASTAPPDPIDPLTGDIRRLKPGGIGSSQGAGTTKTRVFQDALEKAKKPAPQP